MMQTPGCKIFNLNLVDFRSNLLEYFYDKMRDEKYLLLLLMRTTFKIAPIVNLSIHHDDTFDICRLMITKIMQHYTYRGTANLS